VEELLRVMQIEIKPDQQVLRANVCMSYDEEDTCMSYEEEDTYSRINKS
jgi:hypothetical protein